MNAAVAQDIHDVRGRAQVYVGKFLSTFQEFPPRQKPASFSLSKVMEKLTAPSGAQ